MTPNLYICSTYYHVLITICKVVVNKQQADIVLCDDIPETQKLQISLIQSNYFANVIYFDSNRVHEYFGKNKLDWIFFQHKKNRREIEKEFKIDVTRYQDIYIYHDDIILGHYLNDIKIRYHLLEDAQDFYKIIDRTPFARCLPQSGIKYKLRRLLRSGYFPLGQSPYVIDIEVNDNRGLKIHHKNVVEYSKNLIFESLSENERKKICDIFFTTEDFEALRNPHVLLLLAQPLWKDGYVKSSEEQDKVYLNIISKFKKEGYNVVVKQHPRDTTNYEYLSNVSLLPQNLPIETLNFVPIQLDCVATIFSTAIEQMKMAKKKIVIGMEAISQYIK